MKKKIEIDTTGREFNGALTYRRDLCYVNTIIGNGKRREVVVPKWLFYLTWFVWLFKKPHFRKFKEFNVLYENYCPPNEF